ncbi:MAG: hypothetical protein RPU42_14530 [Candidatus Sedimenticola sp. (ex Thyasira tokunagai)]
MKLKEVRDAYYGYSGSASTVSRQASFAGIAIVWIFKSENSVAYSLPETLLYPTLFLVLSLTLDLLQYIYSSAAWGIYHRIMEKTHGVEYAGEVYAPEQINWPTNAFFWGKLVCLLVGYIQLIAHAGESIGFI